jgi:small subunit ribosomal protein S6
MPLYENVFIARQDISGAQVDALADTFTQLVADNGGEVKKREYWGLRNLTYRMRKNRKGHYVLLNLSAPPAAVAELERTMRINEDVIRYMTIRVDELEDGPSVVMQSRGSRDDRQRRGDRERSGDGREMERQAAERPVSEQSVPEQSVPEQSVPEQSVPEQSVPEQSVPEQSVPEHPVPETVEG